MVWLTLIAASIAGTSQLWGLHGELFDPTGRLPDFSYAGYHAGEREIPNEPAVVSVSAYGAIPDDGVDDTLAIQAAIDGTDSGVIQFEAGRYDLSDVIYLNKSNLVLRGQGQDETTLFMSASLTDALGYQVQWSWEGGLIWIAGPESGVPLTEVTQTATRADRFLEVDDASQIAPGQLVALRMTDDESGSMGRHFHNDQEDAGNCSYQVPLRWTWPVQVVSVDGNRVELKQPLRVDARSEWSPTLSSAPYLQEVGIEALTIEFIETEYPGHLDERGYNGIYFANGVANSWVQNVTVVNSDTAIGLDDGSKWITVQKVRLKGRYGHHGFNVSHTADSLFQDIDVEAGYVHTFSIEHRATGSVLSRARSDLEFTIDHHRDGAFENLFTEIDAPVSHFHGGNFCAGWPAGARETFWNNRSPMPIPYWGHIQANVIGPIDDETLAGLNLMEPMSRDREWYENVDSLEPKNLYEAQLSLRLNGLPDLGDSGGHQSLSEENGDGVRDGCGCNTSLSLGWLWCFLPLVFTRRLA